MTRTPRRLLAAALCGTLLVPLAGAALPSASVAPEPSPVQRDWQLDVEVGDLRVVNLPTADGMQPFYYMTFTVINDSGQDVYLAPMYELATDQGELMLSGRNVPSRVTGELLRRLRNPFLQDQVSIIGPIQQGEENARDGLIVWPAGRLDVDEVNVYFMGFSGESKTIKAPDARTGQMRDVTLRKTLMLRHRVPGDLVSGDGSQGGRVLPRYESRWIMRKVESNVGLAAQPAVADRQPAPAEDGERAEAARELGASERTADDREGS